MSYKNLLILVLLLFGYISAQGQEAPPAPKQQADAKSAEAATDKAKQEYPDFKEVTKDMEEHKGLFTLWYYPDDAKDKDKEKLLCQIPSSFLGQMFMLSTSFSGGGFYTGFPLDERVVKWEEFGKTLLLIEPETRFVIDEKNTISDVVRRTHPDKIRAAVPIVTKSPGGDPVIELGPLLKSDFADIGWTSDRDGRGQRPSGIKTELSKWIKKKTFPSNVEIGVELAVGVPSPPGSYEKKLVHYSLWELKKTDYKPRKADDRVGYFLTTNQDWSKPIDERDIFNRYIDRWHLEKRDNTLELCEPIKPIVFYIEKTVPVRFRRAIRDGILEWNKAFEKVGFVNAIQVRQQTEDNEWKDLDPEDMRYSFFRWIVTGSGFAMGPHRANPFTGEIYDADIIFDDSMVRYIEQEFEEMLPSTAMEMKMNNTVLREFLNQFPQFKRHGQNLAAFDKQEQIKFREVMQKRMWESRYRCCDYMEGMKHQMAFAGAILAGKPKEVVERFLYDVVKEVACHEVGHTLGLRHNFAASYIYSLEEIKNRRKTDLPTVGSIMDYNPVLFFKESALEGHFITPTIGPYDDWAIEYGYRPFDEKYLEKLLKNEPKTVDANGSYLSKLSGEEKMLQVIARRATEPELLYATDEDTEWVYSPDPRSNRYDMGSDPFEWAKSRIDLVNERINEILKWGSKDGESWYHARRSFVRLLYEKASVLDYVGRFPGGQYFYRSHRNDPNAAVPFTLVDSKLQREALNFVAANLFNDEFFTFSPEILNHLAPSRWWHDGTSIDMTFIIMDFPIHEYIAAMQGSHLYDRLFPFTLRRIYDAEMKTIDPQKLTTAEYLQTIQNACWGPTMDNAKKDKKWTDASPLVSDIRRSLQREYLGIMEPLVRTSPGLVLPPDLHAMVCHNLEELGKSIDDVLKKPDIDFASTAHLRTCKSRIERMMQAELREFSGSSRSFSMYLSSTVEPQDSNF
jgi:hypothetical protein